MPGGLPGGGGGRAVLELTGTLLLPNIQLKRLLEWSFDLVRRIAVFDRSLY